MFMKHGVKWHELKQYEHNPMIKGATVSPDVEVVIVIKNIGDKQYQITEVITDGQKL